MLSWVHLAVHVGGALQQLGSAPYSVTKHAAVGLAEWLSVSHAHQNISVVCVCPQGVNTPMITGAAADAEDGALLAGALGGAADGFRRCFWMKMASTTTHQMRSLNRCSTKTNLHFQAMKKSSTQGSA